MVAPPDRQSWRKGRLSTAAPLLAIRQVRFHSASGSASSPTHQCGHESLQLHRGINQGARLRRRVERCRAACPLDTRVPHAAQLARLGHCLQGQPHHAQVAR